MTFLEKFVSENRIQKNLYTYIGCPKEFGYENVKPCMDAALPTPSCYECWNREMPGEQSNKETEERFIRPDYYKSGGIECIDAMVSAFGKDKVATWCIINVFKYVWRYHHKNGMEDVRKAAYYVEKYLELTGNE